MRSSLIKYVMGFQMMAGDIKAIDKRIFKPQKKSLLGETQLLQTEQNMEKDCLKFKLATSGWIPAVSCKLR